MNTGKLLLKNFLTNIFSKGICSRILPLDANPGFIIMTWKKKAIHGISSSRSSEYKEIQTCSMSKKKVMVTIFWDARGVLYTEFLTKGLTVNSHRYCATLWSLKQCIRRIRPERNTFLLHHDNARPRCSAQTQDTTTSLKCTVVPHPPYSPDLAPSDLFPKLKETFTGQHLTYFIGCRI